NALRVNKAGRQQALIAARILNYEEIVASLKASGERQLVDQIVSRLSVGASKRTLYQGDGGIFAWFEEPRAPFGNHLDALYALFRNPARVDGLSLDLTIAFGVEPLARWTHPEKGPIAASEFVAAAEQHDRIGKLTDFVLEKAVAAAASINKRGGEFGIAVNLSARLLTDKGFTLRVSALLARHQLAPEHLTLELTETAALS